MKKTHPASETALLWIGVAKILKGIGLLTLGVGLLALLGRDIEELVTSFVEALRIDPDNQYINKLIERAGLMTDSQLRTLSIGTFFYAALFFTEGIGLIRKRRWAEYMTVIVTLSFLPIEIYELVEHPSWLKVAVIALNLGICAYLVYNLRTTRPHHQMTPGKLKGSP